MLTNVKVLVGTFNQEKAPVGALSVIVNYSRPSVSSSSIPGSHTGLASSFVILWWLLARQSRTRGSGREYGIFYNSFNSPSFSELCERNSFENIRWGQLDRHRALQVVI